MSAQRAANRSARRKRTQELQRLLRELRTIPSIYTEEDVIAACADAVDTHDRHFVILRRDVQRIVDGDDITDTTRAEITSRLYDLAFEIHTLKKHVRESTSAFDRQAASIATLQAQMAAISSAISALVKMIRPGDPDEDVTHHDNVNDDQDIDTADDTEPTRGFFSEDLKMCINVVEDGDA